jgi:hypothetical protein
VRDLRSWAAGYLYGTGLSLDQIEQETSFSLPGMAPHHPLYDCKFQLEVLRNVLRAR